MKRKLKGFTLVELVITIAIVIILSVVSVPIYRGYIDKTKWSEAYALMGTVLSAEKAYYSEYGNFYIGSGYTPFDPVLGIDARGNKYFTLIRNWSANDPKYLIRVMTRIPDELVNGTVVCFVMHHNVTTGTTFSKYNDWSD